MPRGGASVAADASDYRPGKRPDQVPDDAQRFQDYSLYDAEFGGEGGAASWYTHDGTVWLTEYDPYQPGGMALSGPYPKALPPGLSRSSIPNDLIKDPVLTAGGGRPWWSFPRGWQDREKGKFWWRWHGRDEWVETRPPAAYSVAPGVFHVDPGAQGAGLTNAQFNYVTHTAYRQNTKTGQWDPIFPRNELPPGIIGDNETDWYKYGPYDLRYADRWSALTGDPNNLPRNKCKWDFPSADPDDTWPGWYWCNPETNKWQCGLPDAPCGVPDADVIGGPEPRQGTVGMGTSNSVCIDDCETAFNQSLTYCGLGTLLGGIPVTSCIEECGYEPDCMASCLGRLDARVWRLRIRRVGKHHGVRVQVQQPSPMNPKPKPAGGEL